MGFVLAVLLASAIQVRVTTVDGVTSDVDLVRVTDLGIQIDSGGNPMTLAFDDLLSVTRTDPPSITSPTMRVELVSGSRVAVSGVTSDGDTATLVLREQEPLNVPIKEIRWLRFRGSSPTVDPQWLGMVDKPRTTDVLVVRRTGDSLDEVEGIVKSMTAKAVTIDLDGEDLPAPIDKLEGVLFANSSRDAKQGKLLIEDTTGSRWKATSITAGKDDSLLISLAEGVTHQLPLSQLRMIESTGSVQFLAPEMPAESSFEANAKIGLNNQLANQWFGAKSDDDRDIVLHADSFVEYRLDGQFSTILGTVLFDPSVAAGGNCSMKVLLDGKVVWDQTFDVSDSKPRGYELPIGSSKRVRFEVKSAGDGDLGDTLRVRQPRLVK